MISGKHVGCHLEFFKNPNDDKVSSARFLKNNAYTTRIHQEKKNFIPNYQVHRKSTKFLLDYQASSTFDKLLHQDNMSVTCIPPAIPLLYSKIGVCGGIPNFLIFTPKHSLWVLVRTASARCSNVYPQSVF